MPDYVFDIGLAISIGIASFLSILIGRRIFKAGVEHFSSRMLILSGIINTALCGLLLLFQGTCELYHVVTSAFFGFGQIFVPFALFVVPAKIIWNYFRVQGRLITRFGLKPHAVGRLTTEVKSLSVTMDISPPVIMSSSTVIGPFVFGRRSSKAILAVPESWGDTGDDNRKIQLLHELAHIRNRDVGFLAWSHACVHDWRWLLIFFPAMFFYCYGLGYERMAPSVVLYLACSVILYVLLRYVVRKRESLADMTTALLVESGRVKDVISEQGAYTIKSSSNVARQAGPKLANKFHRWLTDKALFAKTPKPWKVLLRLFNFFNSLYPSRSDRIKTVSSANAITNRTFLPLLGDSFWVGVALGLMGVIISLGGYWFAMFVQKPQDDMDVLRLPYQIYGLAGPMALGFLTVFLALPVWASLRQQALDSRFLFLLWTRYGIALLGAWLICPLVLIAGAANENILVLTVLCAIWSLFITCFGFGIDIVVIFLWRITRYFQSSRTAELRKAIWTCSLFLAAIFGILWYGGSILASGEAVFKGCNIIFSTVVGLVLIELATRDSAISETQRYVTLRIPFGLYRIEGKWFKPMAWVINSILNTILLFLFAFPIYLVTRLAFGRMLQNLDIWLGIIILCTVLCIILVLLSRSKSGKLEYSKRLKTYSLYHSHKLLSKPLDSRTCQKINKIIATYDLDSKGDSNRILDLTVDDVYELVTFVLQDKSQKELLDQVSSWVLRCQNSSGGFGLWPGSSPRLCSTYQGVSILQDLDLLEQCDTDIHISWIKTLQTPDGSFDDPWSRRPAWENTFHATKSLDMLGASLDPDRTHLCRSWCSRIIVEKGLEKDRPDIIYYCLGTLEALGAIDDDISKSVSAWVSSKIEELLLTNIALNFENVHFVVMTYHLLSSYADISLESVNLLAERVQTALEAELADIRI